MPGVRNGKIYFVPNDIYEKFYLAVKGLNKSSKDISRKRPLDFRIGSR